MHHAAALLSLVMLASVSVVAQNGPRARDLGIPFDGAPGPLNAITDVAGVEVGFTTLISGSGKLVVGQGPVRTGVTAVLPRGKGSVNDPVFAGWYSLNGNGEMTGTTWVEESGFLEGPVMITNTHSVGVVRDAVIHWRIEHGAADASGYWWSLPVVAETWDGRLNDINGFHVTPDDTFHALNTAASAARRRRQRRRRHRNGLPRLQRRHRNRLAQTRRQTGRLHRRRAGAMQLRSAIRVAHRRSSRRTRTSSGHSAQRRHRLDHRGRRHRRSASSEPTQAPGAPRSSRPRTPGQLLRRRLRRHLHRLLHRQSRLVGQRRRHQARRHASQ